MNNSVIAKLQQLNERRHELKQQIIEFTNAPVVDDLYSEEAQQYSDDTLVVLRSELTTILPMMQDELKSVIAKHKSLVARYS